MELEEMKMLWFLPLQFCQACDSSYNSVFGFSHGRKLWSSYDSDYISNSNSFASENQPSMIAA